MPKAISAPNLAALSSASVKLGRGLSAPPSQNLFKLHCVWLFIDILYFQEKLEKLDVDEAVSSCFKDPSQHSDPKTETENLKAKLQKLVSDYREVNRKAKRVEVKDQNEFKEEETEMKANSQKGSKLEDNGTKQVRDAASNAREAEDEGERDEKESEGVSSVNSGDKQLTGKLVPFIMWARISVPNTM